MLDGEDLDVVYIGTPTRCTGTVAAMEPVNMFSVRKLWLNVADAREMYATAERNGVMRDRLWTIFPRESM